MCGSVAMLRSAGEADRAVLSALKRLESRGPDGSGVAMKHGRALAHCRLSLRDHAGGAQPVNLSDGRVLAFVGELYNDHKLRSLLQLSGWSPTNNSDTDVLTAAIEQWGNRAWSELEAMFAIMLLSNDGKCVELVRDRFGVKPIFFARTPETVAAASQPSALLACGVQPAAHAAAVVHFLRTSQIALGQQTVLSNVQIAPPATVTLLTEESANQVSWDDKKFLHAEMQSSVNEKRLTHLLSEAVYRQSRADSPVGVFLSGGLDSSLLAALLANLQSHPIPTFAVALTGDSEDLDYARLVAKYVKSDHVEIALSPESFFESMRSLTAERSVPVSLPNEPLIHKLAVTANSTVKAVLSGEGADELFGGYRKLHARLDNDAIPLSGILEKYRSLTSWFNVSDLKNGLTNGSWLIDAQESDIANLERLVADKPDGSVVRTLLLRDHFPHLLLRLDGATMAGSIEGRVPFTDSDVVEFALSLNSNQLLPSYGLEKPVLRNAALGLLPEEVIRRPKRAFNASLEVLFSSEVGQSELSHAMELPLIAKLFRKEYLERILLEDRQNQVFHRTWLICSLGMWSELCGVSEIC